MRKVLLLLAAGAAFGLQPLTAELGTVVGSLCLILLGALLALTASGAPLALAAGLGSVGAFTQGALVEVSPPVAGALLVGCCFAERSLRVRDPRQRLLHVAVALVAGSLAGWLAATYSGAPLAVRAVVVVITAVLIALPLLLDAEHPVAHALDLTAQGVSEPARATLQAGAELRRSVEDSVLDRAAAREMRATWRSLLRLAEARSSLEPKPGSMLKSSMKYSVVARLDRRLEEHVEVLTRAYTAVQTMSVAELTSSASALDATKCTSESLEEVSSVLLETDSGAIESVADPCVSGAALDARCVAPSSVAR